MITPVTIVIDMQLLVTVLIALAVLIWVFSPFIFDLQKVLQVKPSGDTVSPLPIFTLALFSALPMALIILIVTVILWVLSVVLGLGAYCVTKMKEKIW